MDYYLKSQRLNVCERCLTCGLGLVRATHKGYWQYGNRLSNFCKYHYDLYTNNIYDRSYFERQEEWKQKMIICLEGIQVELTKMKNTKE